MGMILEHSTHTYSHTEKPGMTFTSVTTVLGKYKEKFDEEYHAQRVADREGKTKDQVLAEWKEINRQANEYGTELHAIMERYLLAQRRLYSPRNEFEKNVISSFAKMCHEQKLELTRSDTLKPEHIMHLEFTPEKGLAGTSDIIEDVENDYFNIWDFKTNKRFRYESEYDEQMKFPISHLQYCEYNIYCLQLAVYGVMYERETGKKFRRAGLFYWDKFVESFSFIPVPYMKKEAELIIDHFKMKSLHD